MADQRNMRPGYTVVFPNRYKTSSKAVKAIVQLLLVITAVLMAAVILGSWKKLDGMRPMSVVWILCYLILAWYLRKWNRGLLPGAAAFAVLLLIVALCAGAGLTGTSWFDRAHIGYGTSTTMWGSTGFTPDVTGLLTLLMVPVQILLVIFSLKGFAQGWNVELEVPEEEAERIKKGEDRGGKGSIEPATA